MIRPELTDRIDLYIHRFATLMTLGFLLWALVKVGITAKALGVMAAVSVAGIHLLFCAFGTLFTYLMIEHHFKMGYAALVFTILNSLLI